MKPAIALIPAAFLLLSGSVFAADVTSASAQHPKLHISHHTVVKKVEVAETHKEKSKRCSAEADAQNLHGMARKAFRKTCMKKKST